MISSVSDTLKTWLALGDSYTIGEGVGVNERFPHQTVALLSSRGIPMAEPQYLAQTGWTTGELLAALDKSRPAPPYELVSLLIGVNDQYRGLDGAGYRQRFTLLLEQALRLAGNRPDHVVVLSIPDYSATPFVASQEKEGVSRAIAAFNAINRQVSGQKKVVYVDVTPLSHEAGVQPHLLAADGLHYSGAEYWLWAQMLATVLQKVFVP